MPRQTCSYGVSLGLGLGLPYSADVFIEDLGDIFFERVRRAWLGVWNFCNCLAPM